MADTPDTTVPAGAPGPADHVLDREIEQELHDSYLTYAMSTIMDRALPDVRDGLKPSQRRVLVAMHDLNLTPGRKHIKCAKICGDTSGNYHPHGESVIYPTLVNLGQAWKTRALLVDKQGNFGSIEGDPPAAMRYTEARMTAASVAMLEDLDKETVDFKPNYDDRLTEPTVLPGRFPNLLINGSTGIAVGHSSKAARSSELSASTFSSSALITPSTRLATVAPRAQPTMRPPCSRTRSWMAWRMASSRATSSAFTWVST